MSREANIPDRPPLFEDGYKMTYFPQPKSHPKPNQVLNASQLRS